MTQLFPEVQCGIGPPTDDGFFYDFVVERPFVPEDLDAIEKKMRELAAGRLRRTSGRCGRATRRWRSSATRGEPLKVQLIEEKTAGQKDVSVYTIKDRETFVDFCVGPHVPTSGRLKAFKLLTTSNAYWKGDARNQPMQRIYGTAFFSDNELQAYLTRLEEAKKRDHRKLGRELGLFTFHHWAPGAAFWLDKGTTLYNLLANYMRGVLFPAGYVEVKTPLIYNKALWERSGHWEHYRENMFLIESEGETMSVKPMNCPGHFLTYASEVRQLSRPADPVPRADAAAPQRSLGRAVRPDARPAVFAGRCALFRHRRADWRGSRTAASAWCSASTRDFGLEFSAKLSTRPDEFIGEIATWDNAEAAAEGGARARGDGLHDQRKGRRVLRSEDRLRRHRRHRPQMAVRDDSARLRAAGELRSEVHRRRQHRASARS